MFVDRNNGDVTGVFAVRQREGQEELPDDHADIADFRDRMANPVPQQVGSGQLIQALADLGLLDAVDAAVAQVGGLTQRLWLGGASSYGRHDAMVLGIASALGRTDEQMDELFRLADTK